MANKTVTVTGLQEALDSLTVFQRARIPGSVVWSLSQFGFILRENEQEVIKNTFKNKNQFTINSPLFKKPTKQDPKLVFFLRDNAPRGISPDRYLAPQVTGGEVYVTRFSRALRRAGAIGPNEYILHWTNPAYKPTPGFISALTSAIGRNTGPVRAGRQYARNIKAQSKYFMLGRQQPRKTSNAVQSPRKFVDTGYKGPGIYTRKGDKLSLIYRVISKPATVPKIYDWSERRMQQLADQHLPKLLLDKLAEF
jgi:hypothetical protein